MQTESVHLLLEYWGCDSDILDDSVEIQVIMQRAAAAAKANIVGMIFKPFNPQGVSGVVVIEESHLSIHTWPEHGYAAVDLFTCGNQCRPEEAHKVLRQELKADRGIVLKVRRGIPAPPFLKILSPD